MAEHVFLVPGFFGFANLGELKYFAHVTDELERAFAARSREMRVHYLHTLPTASPRRRAAQLVDFVRSRAGDGGPVHVVGRVASPQSTPPHVDWLTTLSSFGPR